MSAKKDENKANRGYQDGNKVKSHNLSFINTSQPQIQSHTFKKNKFYESNSIHKLNWTDQPTHIRNFWLVSHVSLIVNKTLSR